MARKTQAYEGALQCQCHVDRWAVLQVVFEEERLIIVLFSLDVDGAELVMVLDAINFDKIIIEVMMIEVKNSFCQQFRTARDRVPAKRTALGCQRYDDVVRASDVCAHPQSLPDASFSKKGSMDTHARVIYPGDNKSHRHFQPCPQQLEPPWQTTAHHTYVVECPLRCVFVRPSSLDQERL